MSSCFAKHHVFIIENFVIEMADTYNRIVSDSKAAFSVIYYVLTPIRSWFIGVDKWFEMTPQRKVFLSPRTILTWNCTQHKPTRMSWHVPSCCWDTNFESLHEANVITKDHGTFLWHIFTLGVRTTDTWTPSNLFWVIFIYAQQFVRLQTRSGSQNEPKPRRLLI